MHLHRATNTPFSHNIFFLIDPTFSLLLFLLLFIYLIVEI